MRTVIAIVANLGLICYAYAAMTVPAWRNVVERESAAAVVQSYTSNVVRVEWAGTDERGGRLMPANLVCQFAVVGDSDVTNRVSGILNETVAALNPRLREDLEKYRLLCPTLQWMVRSTRSDDDYLTFKAHPAVFKEGDFNVDALVAKAKSLSGRQVPLPVAVEAEYGSERAPIRRAKPGVDYSDVLPEETFETPFGIGIVLRAPDRFRRIRLRARTSPFVRRDVRFVWRTSVYAELKPWAYDNALRPERGFAEIKFDVNRFGKRMDIAVFAQMPDGTCGVPTIISVFHSPYAKRKNCPNGRLESITYLSESPDALYDLSPMWIPHEWKDDYFTDVKGRIETFNRLRPGNYGRSEEFAAANEIILESYPSGLPKVTRHIEYFISPETKRLDYRQVGEEKSYKFGEYKLREWL